MNRKKKPGKGRRIRNAVFAALLAGYTAFSLLDTFVIPRDVVYAGNPTQASSGDSTASAAQEETSSEEAASEAGSQGETSQEESSEEEASQEESGEDETEMASGESSSGTVYDADAMTYTSDDIQISITEVREYDTTIYIADIYTENPSCLMAGLAQGSFGRNISETTSEIASEVNAVLAVNGDYYGFRDTGYVLRNGILYRDTASEDADAEDLVLYSDGSMKIIKESEVTAEELVNDGAVDIFSFGPGLIENGEITVGKNEEVDQSMNSNPRTAIGMVEEGHYIMAVSDGRTAESEGLTLYELASVLQEYGCTTAYNLDGGGSSTMVFMGNVVNNPTTDGRSIRERKVSDIVYIAEIS